MLRRHLWKVVIGAVMSVTASAGAQPDRCEDAELIPGPGGYSGTTLGATNDVGVLCCGGSDVWYRVEPAEDAQLVASMCRANATWNSVLGVYSACPATPASQLICMDDVCREQAHVELPVRAGNTYYIRVCARSGPGGPFTLRVWYEPTPLPGPDIIVGDIPSFHAFAVIDGVVGYALASTACNVGTADADWYGDVNRHPLIAQSFYRLRGGRFEQLGISWVKHAFAAGNNGICGVCNGHLGQVLGVGCSDPYSALTNGWQAYLGPRSQVNATTGEYPYPFTAAQPADTISRRLQVALEDVIPQHNAGARFFAEVQLISTDDAPAGNGLNNASYREVEFPTSFPRSIGEVMRRSPAIMAWRAADPEVVLVNAHVKESELTARYILGARVTELGDSTWQYEYAVYNHNSDRSARGFEVPRAAAANVFDVGFHDVAYHSGDGIDGVTTDGTDWSGTASEDVMRWTTQTFAENPNANALRWGTLYNFRFRSNAAPAMGSATVALFKPGAAGAPGAIVVKGVPTPTGAAACRPDWDRNGVVNSQDFFEFLGVFFQGNADYNFDGVTNSQDLFDFLAGFFGGC